MPQERAQLDGLSEAILRVLPALERFQKFEGRDPARLRSVWQPALDEPLPKKGLGADRVIDDLARYVVGYGLRIGHPGFTGWVTTAPTTVGAVAQLAQTVAVPQRWWATAGNFVDTLATTWLRDLLGLPEYFEGALVSGGSVANLVGIGAARQYAGEKRGFDPALDGIAKLREPRVYASTEVHHVVGRALGVLGLGRRNLRNVPLAPDHRMDTRALRALLEEDVRAGRTPVSIVATAGDVNMGAIDPIDEVIAIAREHDVWVHVDGAYGGFGLLDDRVRALYGDLAGYGSLAIDPHKWLAAPLGCGAVFVRDGDLLGRAFTVEQGEYVKFPEPEPGDPSSPFESRGLGTPDHGVEFSAPARGIAVWAILREIGADGMRERVALHLDCARRVAERVRASDELELLAEPTLSICCYRYRPRGMTDGEELDALNERIVTAVRARGRCTPSSTKVDGRFAIRPCFINPRSSLADADVLIDETIAVARELSAVRA